jgi:hypothetical protein
MGDLVAPAPIERNYGVAEALVEGGLVPPLVGGFYRCPAFSSGRRGREAAEDVDRRPRDVRLYPELTQEFSRSLHLGDPAHRVVGAAFDETIDEALVGVAKRRGDVCPEPPGTTGRLGGGKTLENRGSEALHEDAAEEFPGCRDTRLHTQDLDLGAERSQDPRIALGAVARDERGCPEPVTRHGGEKRYIRERRSGGRHDLSDLSLHRDTRRVQVGEETSRGKRRCNRRGDGDCDRRRVEAQYELGLGNGIERVLCAPQPRNGSTWGRVPTCSRDAGSDQIAGERAARLAEAEQCDPRRPM